MEKKKLLIIDGHSLITTSFYGNLPDEYKKAQKSQLEEDFQKALPLLLQTSDGVYTNAIHGFCHTIRKAETKYKPDYICVAWDKSRNTFRRKLYPEYKGNRKANRTELTQQVEHTQALLKYVGIPQFIAGEENGDYYEADDIIGSLVANFQSQVDIMVYTKDQDSLQLINDNVTVWLITDKNRDIAKTLGVNLKNYNCPNSVFPFNPTYLKQHYGLTPPQIVDFKAMVGDESDNIPGIAGVGKASGLPLVQHFGTIENVLDFVKTSTPAEKENAKKDLKALGCSRAPFTAIEKDINGVNHGLLSKKLATIKTDLETFKNFNDIEQLKFNINKVNETKIYKRLQFQSLL